MQLPLGLPRLRARLSAIFAVCLFHFFSPRSSCCLSFSSPRFVSRVRSACHDCGACSRTAFAGNRARFQREAPPRFSRVNAGFRVPALTKLCFKKRLKIERYESIKKTRTVWLRSDFVCILVSDWSIRVRVRKINWWLFLIWFPTTRSCDSSLRSLGRVP